MDEKRYDDDAMVLLWFQMVIYIYIHVIYLYISFLEWMFYYFSGGVYHFFCWQELANCGRQLGEAGMFGTSLKKSSKKSTFFLGLRLSDTHETKTISP